MVSSGVKYAFIESALLLLLATWEVESTELSCREWPRPNELTILFRDKSTQASLSSVFFPAYQRRLVMTEGLLNEMGML